MRPCSTMIALGLTWTCALGASGGPSPADLVKRGNAALESGEHDKALEAYRQAEVGRPESPRIKYNRALAHYRKGDFVEAKDLFAESLSTRDLKLEASAHYNLGNCAYRQALEKLKSYDEAVKLAREAIGCYRRSLELDAEDDDARVNIETARLLIKDLQDKKKKEEEERKKQPQSQPSSQPQSQPQSQPSSQPKQKEEQDNKKDNKKGDDKKDEKKQDQKQQDQKQQDQKDKQDEQEKKKEQQKAKGKQQAQRKMSREEAQRLLQAARDKERQRRRVQARKQAAGRIRVDRDW